MRCIKCDKKVVRDLKTKVLIGGVELISYATHKSRHDYGVVNTAQKVVNLCICDDCYEKAKPKGIKFQKFVGGQIVKAGKA